MSEYNNDEKTPNNQRTKPMDTNPLAHFLILFQTEPLGPGDDLSLMIYSFS